MTTKLNSGVIMLPKCRIDKEMITTNKNCNRKMNQE